jgi:hypothetical protein
MGAKDIAEGNGNRSKPRERDVLRAGTAAGEPRRHRRRARGRSENSPYRAAGGHRANQALVRLLAERLNVPRAAVRIVAGEKSRRKRVTVAGVKREQVLALAAAAKRPAKKAKD